MNTLFELFHPKIITSSNTEYREYNPRPELRPYVVCYWISKPKKISDVKDYNTVIPDGCTDIIFEKNQETNEYTMQYCGMFDEYFSVTEKNNDKKMTFGIRFFPGQASHFIKQKEKNLSGKITKIEEVRNDILTFTLKNIFQNVDSISEMIDLFDKALLKALNTNMNIFHNEELLHNVLHQIFVKKGVVSVQEISQEQIVGKRQLNRLFDHRIGLSPKKFIQVIRFQSVLATWIEGSLSNYLQFTEDDFNFYDQSHFVKDILKRSGRIPSSIKMSDFYNT